MFHLSLDANVANHFIRVMFNASRPVRAFIYLIYNVNTILILLGLA